MHVVHESLDRRHTELLVAIRHAGHLGRAASALHLSPSAASHRLREAERRLGVGLTVADGRSLRLTQAGLHIAEVAEIANATIRSAEETARWMSSAERPTVRIALGFYDTAPWYVGLLGVEDRTSDVDIIRVPYDGTTDAVLGRRADVGIEVLPLDAATEHPLAVDELVAIVRRDHPAAARGQLVPGDVADAVYVTAGDRPRHGFEHHSFLEPAGVVPGVLRKVESLAMALRLMRIYGAVTVQPSLALRDADLDGLAIVPLAGTTVGVRWEFVLRPEPAAAELDVCDVVRELVRELGADPR